MSDLSYQYYQSKFSDKKEPSQHIDLIHGGAGLFEGNKRQF